MLMEDLFKPDTEKRGVNKVFLFGALIAVVVIGAAIWALSFRPSIEEQTTAILEGAFREGTPEYAELNKDIIISTDDKTVESPTGLGTISMYINGKIRNKGTRPIDILEVNVAVVTQFKQVLREFVATGGKVVDSSPMYGRSEAVLGDLSQQLRLGKQLFVATKVWTDGRDAGIRQMEESLKRLRLERLASRCDASLSAE